jgi:hypothetical protein
LRPIAGRCQPWRPDYPPLHTTTARYIFSQLAGESPHAHLVWIREPDNIVTEKWAGRTTVDDAVVAAYMSFGEWLLIEAWDDSQPRN